jgi:hypothetical protein
MILQIEESLENLRLLSRPKDQTATAGAGAEALSQSFFEMTLCSVRDIILGLMLASEPTVGGPEADSLQCGVAGLALTLTNVHGCYIKRITVHQYHPRRVNSDAMQGDIHVFIPADY